MKTTTCTLLAAAAIAATGCGDFGGEPDGTARDGDGRSLLDAMGSQPAPQVDEPAPEPSGPDFTTPSSPNDGFEDPDQGQTLDVFDLDVGDCLVELDPAPSIETVGTVACADPHEAEVVSTSELPDGPWPGAAETKDAAEERCRNATSSLPDAAGLDASYLHPTRRSWDLGDHEILCLVTSDAPRRGSVRVG